MKLVFEFRKHYHDGRPANEIVPLVHRLKKRDDLLAKVQRDLDDLLDEIERGRPASSFRSTKAAPRSSGPVVADENDGHASTLADTRAVPFACERLLSRADRPAATSEHRIKSQRSASAAMQKGSNSVANGEFTHDAHGWGCVTSARAA